MSHSRWKPPEADGDQEIEIEDERRSRVLYVRITPSMARALRERAESRNVSVEALVREILLAEAEEHEARGNADLR